MFDQGSRSRGAVVMLGALCLLLATRRLASANQAAQAPSPDSAGLARRGVMQVDGRDRSFLYYVPPTLEPGAALVFAFHGSGGDGARIRGFVGATLERLADAHGFLVVYPDGYGGNWNDCRGRAPFAANRLKVNDVAFVRALLDRFRRERGIDSAHVYALGYSNGGHMAYRLALELPEEIGAVAAFAANLPVQRELDCRTAGEPVPVMVVNGTADRINPYDGGEVTLPDGRDFGHVRSADGSIGYFAKLAGHRGPPARAEILGEADGLWVERMAWELPGAPSVVLYTVHGGGHTIPGSPAEFPSYVGAIERRFGAVEEAVRFFLSEYAAAERDRSSSEGRH